MKRSLLLFGLFIVSIALAGFLAGCGAAKPPAASITSPTDNSTAKIGQSIDFKGVAKEDKSASAKEVKDAKYEWDFGDGSPKDATQNPKHSYKEPKTYNVQLTVRGPKEAANSQVKADSTQIAKIAVKVENTAPTAKATATPPSGDAPLTVQFDGSASSDPDPGSTLKYDWDFGDGAKGTVAKASHEYAKPGDYTITLTVTDNYNATAKATVKVTVKQPAVSTNPAGQGKVQEVKMMTSPDGSKNAFDPPVVTAQPGDTIRWINASGIHSATAYCPKNFNKKLGMPAAAATTSLCFDSKMLTEPNKTFELTIPADAPQGTYAYYCQPHETLGMVGLIVIGKPSDLTQEFIDSLQAQAKTALQNLLKTLK